MVAAVIFAVGLAGAIAIGEWIGARWMLGLDAIRLVQALLCSALVCSLLYLFRRGVDRRPFSTIGLPPFPENIRTWGLGAGVTVASVVVVIGGATLLGMIQWGEVAIGRLLIFVVSSAVLIFFLEALPEEIVFRGYIFTNLNSRLPCWLAVILTTILFGLLPIFVGTFNTLFEQIGSQTPPTWQFVPEGEDPITYFTFLPIFGFVLLYARLLTGSVWTPIAIHMTFLIANRLILGPSLERTGLTLTMQPPGPMLLIPLYLSLTIIVLSMLMGFGGKSIDWSARQPE